MTVQTKPDFEMFPLDYRGCKVGHVIADVPGERDEWEMHPTGDELLYLVRGAIDVILRGDPGDPSDEWTIELRAANACVIPQGAWHRQIVLEPSLMVYVTPETMHRPYEPAAGWDQEENT